MQKNTADRCVQEFYSCVLHKAKNIPRKRPRLRLAYCWISENVEGSRAHHDERLYNLPLRGDGRRADSLSTQIGPCCMLAWRWFLDCHSRCEQKSQLEAEDFTLDWVIRDRK